MRFHLLTANVNRYNRKKNPTTGKLDSIKFTHHHFIVKTIGSWQTIQKSIKLLLRMRL